MQKIKEFFKNLILKIDDKLNAVPKPTLLRISLSLFITGILLTALDVLITTNPNQNQAIMSIAGAFMGISIVAFPYFSVDKFFIGFAKVVCYFFYLWGLLRYIVFYLNGTADNLDNVPLSLILAIMLFIWLSITLKPIFSTIKFVGDKIKELGENNNESNIIIGFKKLFSAFGIITAFIISILTVIDAIIGKIK